MKLVDSRALEFVTKALRLSGRTSGETDFDDEHLQQTLDVSRMLPGEGIVDGWVWIGNSTANIVTGDAFGAVPRNTILSQLNPPPSQPEQLDVWLCGVGGTASGVSGTNAVDLALVSVEYPQFPPGGTGQPFRTLVYTGQVAVGDLLLSTGDLPPWLTPAEGPFSGDFIQRLPIYLPPNSLINLATRCTVNAGTVTVNALYLCWVGPRGMRPPGLA